MSSDPEPFAYIAVRDGRFVGAVACDYPSKKLGAAMASFVNSGASLLLMQTRAEYDAWFANRPKPTPPLVGTTKEK